MANGLIPGQTVWTWSDDRALPWTLDYRRPNGTYRVIAAWDGSAGLTQDKGAFDLYHTAEEAISGGLNNALAEWLRLAAAYPEQAKAVTEQRRALAVKLEQNSLYHADPEPEAVELDSPEFKNHPTSKANAKSWDRFIRRKK